MEDETELKQHFLRREVIDKNYDTGEFLKFLVDKYGDNAADIDQYDMINLKKIVAEFKAHADPVTEVVEEQENDKGNENDDDEIQENNNDNDDKINSKDNKDSKV
jgi:hypothetical protein